MWSKFFTEGKSYKLVLSTCSEYFEEIFERTQCKHPVIVLKDIKHEELEALLNYMYLGEVNVLQAELAGLINLISHQKTHSGEKQFKCYHCIKNFYSEK